MTEERGYDELPDWPLPLGTTLCQHDNTLAASPPVRARSKCATVQCSGASC
eukprot:COSAG06_NODE_1983_length_7920_cov_4.287303_2_plen_51_part_00